VAVRILVAEDEPEMANLLGRGLRAEGYAVDLADNGIDAITLSTNTTYDLAILDVMLPGMSGFELCRRLREQTQGIAIILLTARDAVDDRIRGLDAGADDYLTKPFVFAELAARLRALMRRDAIGVGRLEIGRLRIDLIRHEITCDGRELRLSRNEFDLLRLLAENMDRAVPRSEILESLWGLTANIDANIIDQYVRYVRKKLEAVGAPLQIVNIRGVGFQLAARES